MNLASAIRLILLAAIWGASFLFMRMAVSSFGPAYLIEARVLLAALSLMFVAFYIKRSLKLFQYKTHFFIVGLFNTALPFLLFAYAAQTLTASTLSILNSTAPIWGAVIGILWKREKLALKKLLGLGLGVVGVGVLVGAELDSGTGSITPLLAGVMASFCYGLATNYAQYAPSIHPFDNAHGSMWMASLIVLVFLPFAQVPSVPVLDVSIAVIGLGVVCTGLAYLLYFRLVADVGASSALTVTFLIPLFGIAWGHLVLDEPISPNLLTGAALVIAGTVLVTGFSLKVLLAKRKKA